MTILVICPDEDRMMRLKEAIHAAGFNLITAKAIDDAWVRTDFFDFSAVVIDHALTTDVAASAFGQRFFTVQLQRDTEPESVALELRNVLRNGSELIH